jgi:F0F1-type ATP synthase membrane subunit a
VMKEGNVYVMSGNKQMWCESNNVFYFKITNPCNPILDSRKTERDSYMETFRRTTAQSLPMTLDRSFLTPMGFSATAVDFVSYGRDDPHTHTGTQSFQKTVSEFCAEPVQFILHEKGPVYTPLWFVLFV